MHKLAQNSSRPKRGIFAGTVAASLLGGLVLWGAAALNRESESLAPTGPKLGPGTPSAMAAIGWKQLTSELEHQTRNFSGRVSIYIEDLTSGNQWAHKADELMPSASLIKIPVMAAVMDRVSEGRLSLISELPLTTKTKTSGSGSLKWYRPGTKFTVATLLYHLITESDNTAMRVLINHLGMSHFERAFAKMGLVATNITPEGLELRSRPVMRENYTTAREMGELLEKIYRGQLVSRESSDLMLELMKNLKHRERLAKGLPSGWQIAHKTGLLRRACHDAGIIYSPSGDYVLVVMTWKGGDYRSMKRYISRIGKITYRHYGGVSDIAAREPSSRVRGI